MNTNEVIIEIESLIKMGYINDRQKEALVIALESIKELEAVHTVVRIWKGEK